MWSSSDELRGLFLPSIVAAPLVPTMPPVPTMPRDDEDVLLELSRLERATDARVRSTQLGEDFREDPEEFST